MFTSVPRISASEALRLINEGAVLIDVREQVEWEAGHAPQAEHFPLSTLPSANVPDYGDNRVLVICRSGNRSQQAAAWLNHRGCDAYSVDGGMHDWQALGGAVVTSGGGAGMVI
jgi:rhodanese-related sulfurtransferase